MRYPLPYAFARAALLLLEDDGQTLTLWASPRSDRASLGEALRCHKSNSNFLRKSSSFIK